MKEKIKKNIIGFVLGVITSFSISVIAATYFPSNQTTYDNSVSGLQSTDVQGAIDELYKKCTTVPAANQIIEDNGLEKDEYECRYFFTGSNPNNYITFNDETAGWRIISVECDGTIKIMKIADINTSNTLAWDTSEVYGNNNWSRPADLNTYLNGTYLSGLSSNAQSQIVSKDFGIGGVDYNNNDLAGQVNNENSTTWNGKIALPSVSEYLRTNSNISCKTFRSNNSYFDTCKQTNWMFASTGTEYAWWTLSPYSYDSHYVYDLATEGYPENIRYGHCNGKEGVHPTLFLSSDIIITGGTGTKSDPYEISL